MNIEEYKGPSPEPLIEFNIAGVQHHEYHKVNGLSTATEIQLTPEPTNQYDPNAIEIRTASGLKLGYVPRALTEYIHPLLGNTTPRITGYDPEKKLYNMLKVGLFRK